MPALYIVLQQEIASVNSVVDNHALSKHSHQLETLAEQAGVKPLMSFFSVNPEEAARFLGDHEGTKREIQIPEEQWFAAEEGLNTIEALLRSLGDMPSTDSLVLTIELTELQKALKAAQSHKVRWHLAIDY